MTHFVSAGYQGVDAADFVRKMKASGVTTVADVRLTPLSRKRGFSKRGLSERLASEGIEYVHLRALGNPKDNREPFHSGEGIDGALARCREIMRSADGLKALNDLASMVRQGPVAIFCYESDEAKCHRQVVLNELEQMDTNA